jgi:hypothetical protein
MTDLPPTYARRLRTRQCYETNRRARRSRDTYWTKGDSSITNRASRTCQHILTMFDENEASHAPDNSVQSSHKVQTKSACKRCQKRKSRCSGDRPFCQSCCQDNRECIYDVAEGSTRTEDLKQKLGGAMARLKDLETFIEALRSETDSVSTELYARLRAGASVEELLKMVQAGTLPTWSLEELRATGLIPERSISRSVYKSSSRGHGS